MGFFAFLYMGPIWLISVRKAPSEMIGVVTGYYNTWGSIGAFSFPLLIGFFKDSTGSFLLGWVFVISSCILGALITQFINRETKNNFN